MNKINKKYLKMLSFIIAIVLLIPSLTACNNTESKKESKNTSSNNEKSSDENSSSNSTAKNEVTYDKDQTLRTIYLGPESWDPTQCYDTGTSTVLSAVEAGLFRIYNDGTEDKLVPDRAESYEVSKDGLVYTFHLRSDNKWSDGVPVTAQNYADSIIRALTPENASPYAFFGYGIKNGEALIKVRQKQKI